MVSLGSENGQQGGYFFDRNQSLTMSQETDEVFADTSALTSDTDPPVRRIKTTALIVLQIMLFVIMETILFVVPHFLSKHTFIDCAVDDYSIILYSHSVLWFLVMLIERCLRYQHFISRRNGYLEFYRKTKNIRRVPFVVTSGGNAVLIIVMLLLQRCCSRIEENKVNYDTECSSLNVNRINFLQIIISVENAIILISAIWYLGMTVRFNRSSAAPDVTQDEMLTSFLHSQLDNTNDIGFRDEDYLDEVLEKQADMIRYLKQHNAHLGKKILHLTHQLNRTQTGTQEPNQ